MADTTPSKDLIAAITSSRDAYFAHRPHLRRTEAEDRLFAEAFVLGADSVLDHAAPPPNAAPADGWISVDERLPMQPDAKVTYEQKTYLVTDGDRVEASDFARGSAAGKPWACWSMYGGLPASHITHWRPLPAPPTINASGEGGHG